MKKRTGLPAGSGFDRLVKRRADLNNLPGKQNAFGDRMLTGRQKNTQPGITFDGKTKPNPRAGQMYRSGTTADGRTVHLYNFGGDPVRVVLPKKKKSTFNYLSH